MTPSGIPSRNPVSTRCLPPRGVVMFLNSYRRRLRSAALMRGIVTGKRRFGDESGGSADDRRFVAPEPFMSTTNPDASVNRGNFEGIEGHTKIPDIIAAVERYQCRAIQWIRAGRGAAHRQPRRPTCAPHARPRRLRLVGFSAGVTPARANHDFKRRRHS